MSLTPSQILASPRLRSALRAQAAQFLAVHADMPRLSSVFATHQRYMMGQVVLCLAFRNGGGHVVMAEFLDVITRHRIASRNTADAFIKEMVRYGIGSYGPPLQDRRYRPLVVSPAAFAAIGRWLSLHLATLDTLDGADRGAAYAADPALLGEVQPRIVAALMQSNFCAPPTGTFSLFTWLNEGGLVMDRLMATLADAEPDATHVPTGFSGYGDLQQDLRISRSHLVRNLLQAERMGSLGWSGKRGQSVLWVSHRPSSPNMTPTRPTSWRSSTPASPPQGTVAPPPAEITAQRHPPRIWCTAERLLPRRHECHALSCHRTAKRGGVFNMPANHTRPATGGG